VLKLLAKEEGELGSKSKATRSFICRKSAGLSRKRFQSGVPKHNRYAREPAGSVFHTEGRRPQPCTFEFICDWWLLLQGRSLGALPSCSRGHVPLSLPDSLEKKERNSLCCDPAFPNPHRTICSRYPAKGERMHPELDNGIDWTDSSTQKAARMPGLSLEQNLVAKSK
jgi:hypothetical protein